ncbi:MAG: hypothetical protein JNM84_26020 [Planctomycetes bacterium]|nr:hypothetical protein [Planctomycetota bacterium]
MFLLRPVGALLLLGFVSGCEIHMPPNQAVESRPVDDRDAMRQRLQSLIDQGRYDEASALLAAMREEDPEGYNDGVVYCIENVRCGSGGESPEEAAYHAESALWLLAALEAQSANAQHLARLQEQRQKAEIQAQKFDANQRAIAARRAEKNRDQAAAFERKKELKELAAKRKDEHRDDVTVRRDEKREDAAAKKDEKREDAAAKQNAKRDDNANRQAEQAQQNLVRKQQAEAAEASKRAQQEQIRQAQEAEKAAKQAAQEAERQRKQQEQAEKKKQKQNG